MTHTPASMQFIPGEISYLTADSKPNDTESQHFYEPLAELKYKAFAQDFGPLDMSQLY